MQPSSGSRLQSRCLQVVDLHDLDRAEALRTAQRRRRPRDRLRTRRRPGTLRCVTTRNGWSCRGGRASPIGVSASAQARSHQPLVRLAARSRVHAAAAPGIARANASRRSCERRNSAGTQASRRRARRRSPARPRPARPGCPAPSPCRRRPAAPAPRRDRARSAADGLHHQRIGDDHAVVAPGVAQQAAQQLARQRRRDVGVDAGDRRCARS